MKWKILLFSTNVLSIIYLCYQYIIVSITIEIYGHIIHIFLYLYHELLIYEENPLFAKLASIDPIGDSERASFIDVAVGDCFVGDQGLSSDCASTIQKFFLTHTNKKTFYHIENKLTFSLIYMGILGIILMLFSKQSSDHLGKQYNHKNYMGSSLDQLGGGEIL
ncbi:hypothetical protein ACJX0J_020048 [Zea mays]